MSRLHLDSDPSHPHSPCSFPYCKTLVLLLQQHFPFKAPSSLPQRPPFFLPPTPLTHFLCWSGTVKWCNLLQRVCLRLRFQYRKATPPLPHFSLSVSLCVYGWVYMSVLEIRNNHQTQTNKRKWKFWKKLQKVEILNSRGLVLKLFGHAHSFLFAVRPNWNSFSKCQPTDTLVCPFGIKRTLNCAECYVFVILHDLT